MNLVSKSKGSALVTVLWVVFVVSVISLTLAASVRAEVAFEVDSFDSERAFFMAKGAAETVFFAESRKTEITGEQSPIRREKGDYVFSFDEGEARVRLEQTPSRIDINAASDRLLASLFDSVGADQQMRNRLVDTLLDWRDPDDIPHLYGAEVNDYPQSASSKESTKIPRNGSFGSVDELLLMKNMTPELFYGRFIVNATTGELRRVPGVRELISTDGGEKVCVNTASLDVLLALPEMSEETAKKVVEVRSKRSFENADDLIARVPEMAGREVLNYIAFDAGEASAIVSTARITASNTSRTVRISIWRDHRIQYLSFVPFVYRRIDELKSGRWQYQ